MKAVSLMTDAIAASISGLMESYWAFKSTNGIDIVAFNDCMGNGP